VPVDYKNWGTEPTVHSCLRSLDNDNVGQLVTNRQDHDQLSAHVVLSLTPIIKTEISVLVHSFGKC